jgi:cytochrome c biogenesis protein
VSALYRFFKSTRLAIVLILLITLLSLFSTLIPQGQDEAFYKQKYSPALYVVITTLDFNRFFTSVLFLAPVAMFTLSLGVCAVDRLVRQSRSKARKRLGPDIVHLALLVLIAGALTTSFGRQQKDITMSQGQKVPLDSHYAIKLLSFEFLKYPNGSPRAWISTVDVFRDGALESSAFPIRVNHPLRLKGLAVYQTTWDNQTTLRLRDSTGAEVTAQVGQGFNYEDSFWYLSDVVEDGGVLKALFMQYKADELISMRKLAPQESLGPYTLLSVSQKMATGLRTVSDPGYLPVLVGVVLLALGLALTFLQKERQERA